MRRPERPGSPKSSPKSYQTMRLSYFAPCASAWSAQARVRCANFGRECLFPAQTGSAPKSMPEARRGRLRAQGSRHDWDEGPEIRTLGGNQPKRLRKSLGARAPRQRAEAQEHPNGRRRVPGCCAPSHRRRNRRRSRRRQQGEHTNAKRGRRTWPCRPRACERRRLGVYRDLVGKTTPACGRAGRLATLLVGGDGIEPPTSCV